MNKQIMAIGKRRVTILSEDDASSGTIIYIHMATDDAAPAGRQTGGCGCGFGGHRPGRLESRFVALASPKSFQGQRGFRWRCRCLSDGTDRNDHPDGGKQASV